MKAMKTILLCALTSLGLSVAFATPITPVGITYQCPDAADLQHVVKNPIPDSVFIAYTPADPMYNLILTATDILFFSAYVDNGVMRCSYSSSNRLLAIQVKPELENTVFVNSTPGSNSGSMVACTANPRTPEHCKFYVGQ